MDRAEGVPDDYSKKTMKMELQPAASKEKFTMQGLFYIDEKTLDEGKPTEEYIQTMNKAINDAAARGFPQEYIKEYLRVFIRAE